MSIKETIDRAIAITLEDCANNGELIDQLVREYHSDYSFYPKEQIIINDGVRFLNSLKREENPTIAPSLSIRAIKWLEETNYLVACEWARTKIVNNPVQGLGWTDVSSQTHFKIFENEYFLISYSVPEIYVFSHGLFATRYLNVNFILLDKIKNKVKRGSIDHSKLDKLLEQSLEFTHVGMPFTWQDGFLTNSFHKLYEKVKPRFIALYPNAEWYLQNPQRYVEDSFDSIINGKYTNLHDYM